MENWLRKNRDVLNLLAIERKLGCSRSTLSKVANDDNKKLPKKWVEPLRELREDLYSMPPIYSNLPDSASEMEKDCADIVEGIEKEQRANFKVTDICSGDKGLGKSVIQEMVEKQKLKKK